MKQQRLWKQQQSQMMRIANTPPKVVEESSSSEDEPTPLKKTKYFKAKKPVPVAMPEGWKPINPNGIWISGTPRECEYVTRAILKSEGITNIRYAYHTVKVMTKQDKYNANSRNALVVVQPLASELEELSNMVENSLVYDMVIVTDTLDLPGFEEVEEPTLWAMQKMKLCCDKITIIGDDIDLLRKRDRKRRWNDQVIVDALEQEQRERPR